jgi:hypothetical protein
VGGHHHRYLDLVIAAARERGLPGGYIEQIEAVSVADNPV